MSRALDGSLNSDVPFLIRGRSSARSIAVVVTLLLPLAAACFDTSALEGNGATADGGSANDAANSDLLDGCILLLHLDEQAWSGAGAAKDSSGNGNDATPVGATTTTTGGKYGRAATFDGTDWLEVPASVSLDGPFSQLTYAAWIYPTPVDAGIAPGVISKRLDYQQDVDFTLFIGADRLVNFDLLNDRSESFTPISNGVWTHVAIVYDGSQPAGARASVYINGALDSAHPANTVLGQNTETLLIGNLGGGGGAFIGLIDDVAIWKRALTASEIINLYNATTEL